MNTNIIDIKSQIYISRKQSLLTLAIAGGTLYKNGGHIQSVLDYSALVCISDTHILMQEVQQSHSLAVPEETTHSTVS